MPLWPRNLFASSEIWCCDLLCIIQSECKAFLFIYGAYCQLRCPWFSGCFICHCCQRDSFEMRKTLGLFLHLQCRCSAHATISTSQLHRLLLGSYKTRISNARFANVHCGRTSPPLRNIAVFQKRDLMSQKFLSVIRALESIRVALKPNAFRIMHSGQDSLE